MTDQYDLKEKLYEYWTEWNYRGTQTTDKLSEDFFSCRKKLFDIETLFNKQLYGVDLTEKEVDELRLVYERTEDGLRGDIIDP